MSEDESGEGSASSADEDPVDQDEDSQADLNASMQEMNVQQVRIIALYLVLLLENRKKRHNFAVDEEFQF